MTERRPNPISLSGLGLGLEINTQSNREGVNLIKIHYVRVYKYHR
jgi:hypothetical protein